MTSAPAQDALDSLNISLTDKDGNLRDIIDVYTEVGKKVKNVTDTERIAVTEGLAGKYHIARMQVLLDDLASADSMYRSMYESSTNSAGSAMTENERYMESLQARINLARVETEKLALAFSEAFLQEGMIQAIRLFGNFLGVLTNVTNTIGALPIILSTLGVAVTALSTRFRNLITSMGIATWGALRGQITATTTATRAQTVAVGTLSKAWKGFLASTGFGLILVGVGIGLEALIGKMGEARERTEELERHNKQLAESYENNKDTIDELARKYNDFNNKASSGLLVDGTKEHQEYLDVQKQLATLIPELVIGEDSKGNAILASSEIVKAHIEILRERLEVEKALRREEEIKSATDRFNTSSDQVKNAKNESELILSTIRDTLRNGADQVFDNGNIFKVSELDLKTFEDVSNLLEEINKKKKDIEQSGIDFKSNDEYQYYERLSSILSTYGNEYTDVYKTQTNAIKSMQLETQTLVNSYIAGNDSMSIEAKNFAMELFKTAVAGEQSSDKLKEFQDLANNLSFSNDFAKEISDFENAIQSLATGNGSLENVQDAIDKTFDKLSKKVLESSGFEEGSKQYDVLNNSLLKVKDSQTELIQKVQDYAKTNRVSMEDAYNAIMSLGDSYEEVNNELQDFISSLKELTSVEEKLVGTSNKQVSEVRDLIYLYNTLSSQTDLTAQQTEFLRDAQEKLSILYPHLIENGRLRIDKIYEENEAQGVLLEAYKNSAQGKYTSEQNMTLIQADATSKRIENIKKEIQALQALTSAYNTIVNRMNTTSISGVDVPDEMKQFMQWASGKNEVNTSELDGKLKELSGLQNSLTRDIGTLRGYNDSVGGGSKSSKGSKSKDSIYLTDQYKQSLEEVNLEIEKQKALRENEVDYSNKYRQSLADQIKLEQQKLSLQQSQAKSLQDQIKSGKIWTTSGIKTDKQSIDGAKSELLSIQSDILSQINSIKDLENQVRNSKFSNFENLHSGIDRYLQRISLEMSRLEEGSEEYSKQLQIQLQQYRYKQTLIEQENQYIKEQLQNTSLTSEEVANLNSRLSDTVIKWHEVENSIYDTRQAIIDANSKIADSVIDSMKDSYARQRDIASAQYDAQLDALEEAYQKQSDIYDEDLKAYEKAHEEKVKLLDDEAKKYEESIRKKIDAIDKQRDAENYNKEVANRQKEINEIQSRIDQLSLDNSYSAQAEKADLEKELAKLKDNLGEYQTDREIELRKDNLQQQLDAYQKEIEGRREVLQEALDSYKEDVDAKKKAEQDKYEAERKRIEQAKRDNERHFNELIANERQYAKTREEIINGNLDNVKASLQKFLDDFSNMNEETAKQLGMSWQELLNLIDAVNSASGSLDKVQPIPSPSNNSPVNSNPKDNISANDKTVIEKMKLNSQKWINANATERKKLEEENQKLGKSIGATYKSSEGKWYKNGVPLYHNGGIVGDQPTNRLSELANKLFNTKPNEQMVKSLMGELQIPPKNISNGFNNIKNMVSQLHSPTVATTGGISINNMNVRIDSLEGGEKGAKDLFKHIEQQMVKRGGRK